MTLVVMSNNRAVTDDESYRLNLFVTSFRLIAISDIKIKRTNSSSPLSLSFFFLLCCISICSCIVRLRVCFINIIIIWFDITNEELYPNTRRLIVTKERMLIPPSSTFSNTNTNSNDDSVLTKRTPRVTRSSSCDTFSTADMSEQLSIYDQGSSSILVPHLPETQNFSSISLVIGNAIQTLYSEQVENSSSKLMENKLSNLLHYFLDVAYDAVPDQCNWNETGIKLFENNENLYDPFNSSIELVHQPHTSSRLNQSSTTISDRSANITTDNSRNSSVEHVHETQSETFRYNIIVCFGDSHSDTVNLYNLTGSKWPINPPYYRGRFSNGNICIEQLGIFNLMNYAYESATTDNDLVPGVTEMNITVPDVRQQISLHKNNTDLTKINFDQTIYIIWAGANDYFLISIYLLAKHIIIVNQPSFQSYPAVVGSNISPYLNQLTLAHNSNLSNVIQSLQLNFSNVSLELFDYEKWFPYLNQLTLAHNSNLSNVIQSLQLNFSNVSLELFDVYSLLTNILMNSSTYGINSTKNCWDTSNHTCIQMCSSPDTYIFIDEYHFTTRVHQRIADNARILLVTSKGTIKAP
ncbi:unnamed protein product [Rotaria magnacalcarata]|uniref:Uncharacterized protein n=1 Tax=Rotaria magnacalcarata TaxID=392030 RepID=A0A816WJD5_9BILA|nr:unnamed protein product [Rotaria magnacalcarata]